MPDPVRHNSIDEAELRSVRDVRIGTPHLVLREHRESDLDAVLAYASDPEVARLAMTATVGRDAAEASLRRSVAHRAEQPLRLRYELAITRPEDDAVIGWIPLIRSDDPEAFDAEIGWTLAPAFWGQGYATEAAAAALAFSFERLELHRVWARCQAENQASIRVMEKLGMRCEAHFRRCRFVNGVWVDVLHYAVLEDEWWERKRTRLPASFR